jgi:hypothetical protein
VGVKTLLCKGLWALCIHTAALSCQSRLSLAAPNPDEAQAAGAKPGALVQSDDDYFRDMDNGLDLSPAERRGRNMWLLWTGGNDRFWDAVTKDSAATFDLLKIITSHPAQTYCHTSSGDRCDRDTRWGWLGAVTEPCFEKATAPDPKRFGLWFDVRANGCKPDPFEDGTKYPGIKIGARGTTFKDGTQLPIGSYYGYATGILGLRLFPNPKFDQAAKDHWDPERYYTDPNYYNDPKLVKPYRVGMACGFCHVGPNPLHPPVDPAHPTYADINSTVGSQYLWMDRVFVGRADPQNFFYQLVHAYPPGTMDTSLVSTDYILNPRTMNAIYNLGARLAESLDWGKETLADGELNNKQATLPAVDPLDGKAKPMFVPPNTSYSARVLKDGSDSVGILGALNRVYLNIGLYSEEWAKHFNPFFGGKGITPILIATAEANSVYWRATEAGTPDMASFLLKAGQPDQLDRAPGGKKYLTASDAVLDRGKTVFADTCARCHSSKLPPEARAQLAPGGCSGPHYLACFTRYWAYTKTDAFKVKMRTIVAAPDFLNGNYLSTDARIPVTLLRTNACSPLGTNAIRGNIWDNFSSETYKSLPSVGKITVQDPFTGEHWQFQMPAGGLGFTRVPSLISIWSTAPFFVNNRLGPYSQNPTIDDRLKVFDASIHQLLWPETRDADPGFDGYIVRTDARSYVEIPKRNVPIELNNLVRGLGNPFKTLFNKDGDFSLGPIPKGFPIGLAASYQPLVDMGRDSQMARIAHERNVARLIGTTVANTSSLDANADDSTLLAWTAKLAKPLLKLSKCPDYVVNRGHYFGTQQLNDTDGLTNDEKSFGKETPLSNDDKNGLIEFLKTF